MGNRHIATITGTQTTNSFNELTNSIRSAGFEVERVSETSDEFYIRIPEGYDEEQSVSVLDAAYHNRVESDAKEFIRTLVTEERLFQEIPGSIPVQKVGDYEEVLDIASLNFSQKMVLMCSTQTPPPNAEVGTSAVERIGEELVAMYAKDVAKRASELVEGTEFNGWTPEWDAIESNDEYECYVYVEENDPNA